MGVERPIFNLKARIDAFRQRPETERNLIFARLVLVGTFSAQMASIILPFLLNNHVNPSYPLYYAGMLLSAFSTGGAFFNELRRDRQNTDRLLKRNKLRTRH